MSDLRSEMISPRFDGRCNPAGSIDSSVLGDEQSALTPTGRWCRGRMNYNDHHLNCAVRMPVHSANVSGNSSGVSLFCDNATNLSV
jgi:hypothetical protein